MTKELADYYNIDDGFYVFPTIAVAMRYVDEMTDDDQVVIEDRADSLLMRKIQKALS
jgi:hypothetical protein